MALQLTLVRHAQARFDEDNYDLLSERGRRQARALGRWWQAQDFAADQVWSGGMVRQTETAELALQALCAGGGPPPPVQIEARLREFDHREIFYRHRPDLLDPVRLERWKKDAVDYAQTFAATYDAALQRWMSGWHDAEYAESWLQFKARCVAGLQDICAASLHNVPDASASASTSAFASGSNADGQASALQLLVFTSSGPISAIIQSCWELPDQRVRAVQQGLMNSGLTSVRVGAPTDWTLETINACPHLVGDRQDISWR